MHAAGAEAFERLLARLQYAGGRDGHVVVGQQGIHGFDVAIEDCITPLALELVDLVAAFVLLCDRKSAGEERNNADRQCENRGHGPPGD